MTKKSTKRIRVEDPATAPTGGAVATQGPSGGDTQADPKVTVTDRQYVGPWGPEWICVVQNLEHPGADGVIWTVTLNSDERRFLNQMPVQLSDGHLEVLDHATIRDERPIDPGSGFYLDKAKAEKENPGMRYQLLNGEPHLVRHQKRYMYSKIRPADSPPLLHGGVKEE